MDGSTSRTKFKRKVLQKCQDLPDHLRFNPYILKGYRPLLTTKECLKSLLYFHNETFNIYSHLFAFMYFTASSSIYNSVWNEGCYHVRVFVVISFLVSTLPFLASVAYHLFMPHVSGCRTYRWLLKVDVVGVWCMTSVGAVPQLWSVTYCHSAVQTGAVTLYATVSAFALWIILVYDSAIHRVVALTLQYFFRIGFHVFRMCPWSGGHPYAFLLMTVVDMLAAPGALVNGLKIPERQFPGKLDYLGNGHTIMHVVSFFVVLVSRRSLLLDMEWYNTSPCMRGAPGNHTL
jgi:predicted membrane channel-forming protein YqfA (hemolysin III family)